MALADSNDPNKDFINALTYLGKGPFNIGMPGGSDISVGAGPAPAPGVNVGTFGQHFGGGPAQSGAVGAGGSASEGSNILGLLQKYLGAGAKTADFASKLGGSDTQGLDVLKDMAGSGELGLGADTALSGLGTELPNTQLQNTPEFAGLLKDLQGSLGSSSLEDPTLGLTGAIGGEAGSSLGSLSGSLGAGASGAGALGAILGAIASQTGDQDLAKAAQYIGAAGSAAGLAGTGASLAATGGTLAATGATAGLGAAAGAAFAPITAMMLASMISGLAGGDDPVGEGIGEMMQPLMGNYSTFGKRLGQTLGLENADLANLAQVLPYVQSQQDLQDVIGQFKSSIGNRVGGYGEGSGPYEIPGLPGATGTAHEWNQVADFGLPVDVMNQLVGGLKDVLPQTGGAGGAGLWNTALENARRQQARATGFDMSLLPYMTPEAQAEVQAMFPEPTSLGAVSPYWTQYLSSLSGAPAPAAAQPGPAQPGTPLPDVYQDLLKQMQGQ